MEAVSRRAYKRLVFELTGDVLREMYRGEEEATPTPWSCPPRPPRKRYHRSQDLPTTVDALQPLVQETVGDILGLDEPAAGKKKKRLRKWKSRKRPDHVDSVLLQELAEEEPDWVDYHDDELTVKMQIADSIFDALLVETGHIMLQALGGSMGSKSDDS